jgi:hypothetical protein
VEAEKIYLKAKVIRQPYLTEHLGFSTAVSDIGFLDNRDRIIGWTMSTYF